MNTVALGVRAKTLDGARIRSGTSSCGLLINVMKAAEHRCRDDLSSLSASMRRRCSRRPLAYGPMRAPVVEIADILGQDLLQMAFIEYEHVVEALGPDRFHPALGDGVGSQKKRAICSSVVLLSGAQTAASNK